MSEEEESSTSKLWGCLSEILQQSNQSVSTEGTNSGEDIEASEPKVDQYLTAPLLDFKIGNPFKWQQDNYHCYSILAKVARGYLQQQVFILSTSFLQLGRCMMIRGHEWCQS